MRLRQQRGEDTYDVLYLTTLLRATREDEAVAASLVQSRMMVGPGIEKLRIVYVGRWKKLPQCSGRVANSCAVQDGGRGAELVGEFTAASTALVGDAVEWDLPKVALRYIDEAVVHVLSDLCTM